MKHIVLLLTVFALVSESGVMADSPQLAKNDPAKTEAPKPAPAKPEEANYDETKVPAYTLPDPLVLADGKPVSDAATWTQMRRPELLNLFETHVSPDDLQDSRHDTKADPLGPADRDDVANHGPLQRGKGNEDFVGAGLAQDSRDLETVAQDRQPQNRRAGLLGIVIDESNGNETGFGSREHLADGHLTRATRAHDQKPARDSRQRTTPILSVTGEPPTSD